MKEESGTEELKLGKTGYYAGKLFIQNEEITEIELHKPTATELGNDAIKKRNTFLYDNNSGNVHFFPDDAVQLANEWSEKIEKKRTEILNILKDNIKKYNLGYILTQKGNRSTFANNTIYKDAQSIFKYIGITCGNRNYDLVFCRFYKTEYNKSVNCILNGIQFEVYGSQKIKSIDIYPTSEKDGERTCLKDNAKDFYYNPYVKFYDKAEDIADAFLEFIASNEKNKVNDIYIIQKSALSYIDSYFLKLNRELNKLEVYQKVDNDELQDYYSIRENFNSEEYILFGKKKIFECIIGDEDSPTPTGIFRVENKSKGEYISNYYDKYDKVKFFGYLVVFEDYFIHSVIIPRE